MRKTMYAKVKGGWSKIDEPPLFVVSILLGQRSNRD